MRRIIAIILIQFIVISQMSLTYATSNTKIYIENTNYSITRTDNVLVPIMLDSPPTTGSYGGGIIFSTFDNSKLQYVGIKTGTMLSQSGNTIAWQSNDIEIANQTGEVRIAYADDTTERSKSYGDASYISSSNDCILYLEFSIIQKNVEDKIPVNLTRAELAGNTIAGITTPTLLAGSNFDTVNGFVYISSYNYINSFSLEVYGETNGVATTQTYPAVVDGTGLNKFNVIITPNKDGIVKATIIPNFAQLGISLVISCADSRVLLDGYNITIPAIASLIQADLIIRIKREDGSIDTSGEYLLSVVRGNGTAIVTPTSGSGNNGASPISTIIDSKHISYIKGYPNNNFESENFITRAEAVAMISRLTEGFVEGIDYASNFMDIDKDEWYSDYIGFMGGKQIIIGYFDGNFKPNDNITRAEFATIVARFKTLNSEATNSMLFSDTVGHWAIKYLTAIYDKGYISGYPDGTFMPDKNITRAEAVKVLNLAMGRTPSKDDISANLSKYIVPFNDVVNTHWAYYDILEAAISHDIVDFHK